MALALQLCSMNIEKGIAWSISGQKIDAYAYPMHTWRQTCRGDKGSDSGSGSGSGVGYWIRIRHKH